MKVYKIGLRIGVLVLIFVAIWAISFIAAQGIEEPEPVEPEPVEPEPVAPKVFVDRG